MLTDEEARELLHQAGDTIDVTPRAWKPVVRRPRSLPIAAAAAAVALVAAGAAGAGSLLHHDAAAPQAPTADLDTSDPAFRLGPDQVPSVAGLDATQARRLLITLGYRVEVSEQRGCPSAQSALSVEPGPGTILDRRSTVTLRVITPDPAVRCALGNTPDARVMAFLAWSRGLGPEPPFSPLLTVQLVDRSTGEDSVTRLRGAAAADRHSWPGLAALANLLAAPVRGMSGLLPLTVTRMDSTCLPTPGGTCPEMPGAALGADAGSTSHRSDTDDGFTVDLQISSDGTIGSVALVDQRAPSRTDVPDVVGDSAAYATTRLRAFGLHVTRRDVDACAQRDQVTRAEVSDGTATISVSRGDDACAG
jgi:hypothetical protein